MANAKTPSLADLLRSQDSSKNKDNKKTINSELSLASLLPTNQQSSGLPSLTLQNDTGLRSLMALSSKQNKTSPAVGDMSLKSLLSSKSSDKKSSEKQLPSLSDLLSSVNESTGTISSNHNEDSTTPQLCELMHKTNINSNSNCSMVKTSNLSELLQKAKLEPTKVHAPDNGMIPDLATLMRGSHISSKENRDKSRTPNLSELLQKASLNSSENERVNLKELSNSMENVLLSDLALKHVGEPFPSKHHQTLRKPKKLIKRRPVPYKKDVSAFGKIMGAFYVRHRRLRNTLVVRDNEVVYTGEMFGTLAIDDVYMFDGPSPDDVIKKIQGKAFERDLR